MQTGLFNQLSSIRRLPLIAFVATGIWNGLPAHAQQSTSTSGGSVGTQQLAPPSPEGGELGEVVVTARRREESLQSVPIAITALSGQDLQTRGVLKTSDLMTAVPGVFTAPGTSRGDMGPVFAIRGQLERDPGPTYDPSVGLYFGEVPWARVEGTNAAFMDLQSVQVLKGPQGTLFGRNSTAGAILITPNPPTSTFGGYGEVVAGNYGLIRTEGVINLPATDKLELRLAVNHEQRDGYLEALPSHQWLDNLNDTTVRLSAKFTPTENFTTTLIGMYLHSDTNGTGEKLIGVSPASPSAGVASLYPMLATTLAQDNALGRYQFLTGFASGIPNEPATAQYARVTASSVQDKSTLNLGNSALLGDLFLNNIISFRDVNTAETSESVSTPFLSSSTIGSQDVEQGTEELQLQGTRGPLDYVAGLFYFREWGHDTDPTETIVPIVTYTYDNHVVNTSYSAYGHMNYNFSAVGLDGLSLAGGVRFNDDRRYIDYRNRRATTAGYDPTSFTCFLNPAAGPNNGSLCNYPVSATFREPTWNVDLNYEIAPHSLLYVSAGHGYRSGGFSEGAQNFPSTTPFLPEEVYTYEFGSKNDFNLGGDAAARVNVAGYYTDYHDIQRTLNMLGSNGLYSLTTNAARAHIIGAEADITVKPTLNWELILSYAYTAPKYDSFTDTYAETNPAYIPAGVKAVYYPVDVSDSQFILVSKNTVNLDVSYSMPVAESVGKPKVSANYYYRTSFFTTTDINTPNCKVPGDPNPGAIYVNCYNHAGLLPGYGLLNLRFDWANVLNRHFNLDIFVDNVTDKYYFTNAFNALSALGSITAQIGPPRMFGVGITVPFGKD
jgi:iron complex outermembrane recepter protein